MKKNLLIVTIIACLGCIIFSSYEHGPAYEGGLNRTGSQGGGASCSGSGCHDPNNPATIVALGVYDATGSAVTQYTPGQTYTVAITGHHTTSLSLTEFGFQVSAVQASSADQAGSFAVPSGSNLRVTPLSGLQIVEHKKALHDSVTNYFVARFSWTAPASGTGNVQFYGILNPFGEGGSGGDDDDDDDDGGRKKMSYALKMEDDDDDDEGDTTCPNIAPVLTLTEKNGGASSVSYMTGDNDISIFPNPCTSFITVRLDNSSVTQAIVLYAMNGAKVYTGTIDRELTIPVNELPAGIYQVEISGDNRRIVKTMIKQ